MINTPRGQQVPVNVVGSSTFGRYNKISSEKTYNMFITDEWLVNFAGYKKIHEFTPEGSGRGIFHSVRGNLLLVIINDNVYSINQNIGVVLIGQLETVVGEVFIDENLSSQICIVDGINAYIYNHSLAPNLTVQSLSGTLIPNYVTYHNTFFLFGNGDTTSNGAAWYAYSFASPTTISQTTQLALQTKPDFAVAVKRIPGQAANVLVLGTSVCEIHTQVGGLQNYRRNNTASIDYGCLSISTIDSAEQYIAWLGVNERNAPVIMVFSAQGITPISSDGIDYLLASLEAPDDSTAMFFRVDGHLIYQLTFYNEADNLTLMYDFTTQKFFNLSDQHLDYHPAREYAYFDNKTYFLSLNNGSLYEIGTDFTFIDENIVESFDPTYDSDLVFEIQRIRITENVSQADTDRFMVNYLSLMIEQGCDPNVSRASLDTIIPIITETDFVDSEYPLITEWGIAIVMEESWGGASVYTPPYEPRVDLTLSYDGGITWTNTISRDLNPIGYRRNILNWNKLGACNTITFKFRFWGTFRFIVNNAVIEVA